MTDLNIGNVLHILHFISFRAVAWVSSGPTHLLLFILPPLSKPFQLTFEFETVTLTHSLYRKVQVWDQTLNMLFLFITLLHIKNKL